MNRSFLIALGLTILIAVSIAGGLPILLGLLVVAFFVYAGLWALTVILKGFFPWAYPNSEPVSEQIQQVQQTQQTQAQPNLIVQSSLPQKMCECGKLMEAMPSIPGYYCWGCGRNEIISTGNGHP